MKKRLQRRDDVVLAAMAVLQRELDPSINFDSWLDYSNYDIDPNTYSSESQFKRDYAYISFLRKYKGLSHESINPEWKAFSTWIDSEKLCFRTNSRLELETSTGCYSVAPALIISVQRKIAQILGPLDIDRITELCRFGKGATFDLRHGSTHAEKTLKPTITFDAIPWICKVITDDQYMQCAVGPLSDLSIVRSNRMVMVPKSVKTHRPIAAEPTLNGYVQQGVGRYIRQRLLRFGVDLDDQTINQDYARRAQVEGLATIDLSSASDTLCTNLVKLLVPREWYEMLDDLRSKRTTYKGKVFNLSKFSSMGNAYTFELESLIFYALVSCASSAGVTSVYGDDIIVHSDDYRPTLEILTWAGFKLNEHKSFTKGSRFYESCGKHYFDTGEVTPCYQKDVCSRPHDYVRLHNRLVRAGIRLNLREEFNSAARVVRAYCRDRFVDRCPDVGPLVEYDEYFIKEVYFWASDRVDSVQLKSCLTVNNVVLYDEEHFSNSVYLGRKLRCPSYLNPDRDGQCSDSDRPKLLISKKYHWRSLTASV